MRLVVSPHLDDAVLGAGGYLSDSHEPVVTVFDGAPTDRGLLTDYDKACGFSSSVEAMECRALEDAAALRLLACPKLGLGWLDTQYDGQRPKRAELADQLERVLREQRCEGVVGPLGVQHPDHVLTSDACLILANRGVPVWFYEELPYRVVWPEHAAARQTDLAARGWHLVPDLIGGGGNEWKEGAVLAYTSQRLDLHCCLVPERFWAVTVAS